MAMDRAKVAVAVALMLMAQPALAVQTIKIGVGVSCDKPTSLQLSVKNISPGRAEFAETLLPWNHSKVLRMEAFQVSNGKSKRLAGIAPVADYLRKVSLAPQQALKGELLLSRSFAGFDDANESGDILVFYRVNAGRLSEQVSFSGNSGVVLIPKNGLFTRGCPALVNPNQAK